MKDEFERTQTKQRKVGDFMYAAQSWTIECRVITWLEYDEHP